MASLPPGRRLTLQEFLEENVEDANRPERSERQPGLLKPGGAAHPSMPSSWDPKAPLPPVPPTPPSLMETPDKWLGDADARRSPAQEAPVFHQGVLSAVEAEESTLSGCQSDPSLLCTGLSNAVSDLASELRRAGTNHREYAYLQKQAMQAWKSPDILASPEAQDALPGYREKVLSLREQLSERRAQLTRKCHELQHHGERPPPDKAQGNNVVKGLSALAAAVPSCASELLAGPAGPVVQWPRLLSEAVHSTVLSLLTDSPRLSPSLWAPLGGGPSALEAAGVIMVERLQELSRSDATKIASSPKLENLRRIVVEQRQYEKELDQELQQALAIQQRLAKDLSLVGTRRKTAWADKELEQLQQHVKGLARRRQGRTLLNTGWWHVAGGHRGQGGRDARSASRPRLRRSKSGGHAKRSSSEQRDTFGHIRLFG
mmetsp:Transcript_57997/g.135892  ORF Transcript_57997/g.135892 Transcript_57997/m.135892 type:complete len:431 (+) Transcript_57997:56-1348(+)